MFCGRWRCGSGLLNTVEAWMMPPKDVRHVAVGFGVCRFGFDLALVQSFLAVPPFLTIGTRMFILCHCLLEVFDFFFGMVKRPFCGVREMAKLLGEYYYSYRGSEFYSQHTCNCNSSSREDPMSLVSVGTQHTHTIYSHKCTHIQMIKNKFIYLLANFMISLFIDE